MSNIDNLPPTEKVIQGRNWAFIAYLDSMPDDLFKQLEDSADRMNKSTNTVTYFVSPLHDKDKFDNGELKKPHYHVFMCHKSEITQSGAIKFGKILNLVGCERIASKKKYARYLCHLDEKDKELYNIEDVKTFGKELYIDVIGSTEDKYKTLRDIILFINEKDYIFYSDFVQFCMESNDDWFRFLMSGGTYQIEKYIKERRLKMQLCKEFTSYFDNEIAQFNHYRKMLRDVNAQ